MSPGNFSRLIALLCLLLLVPLGPAQEADDGTEIRREQTIYIHYDKLRQVFEQPGRGVFLPYEEFQTLWNAANRQLAPTPLAEVPVAAMISEMVGTATVYDEVVKVDSKISLELFRDGWHTIPLRLADVAITSATIDGKPARILGQPGQSYQLLIEKPKNDKKADNSETTEHKPTSSLKLELALSFAKAIEKSPGRNAVAFDIPQAPLSRWKVIVPESGVKVDFFPLIAASE